MARAPRGDREAFGGPLLSSEIRLNLSASTEPPIAEMLIGVALLVSACIAIYLTRVPGGIALFWPGSAITAGLLIRLPRVRWLSAVLAIIAAMLLANVIASHRPWPTFLLLGSVSLAETALMVVVFRSLCRWSYPDLTVSQAAAMTVGFGILIPGITAAVGGLALRVCVGTPWRVGAEQWWSSHLIGACLFGPVLMLYSAKGVQRLLRPKFAAENLLLWMACVLGCYATIAYVRFPFVSIGLLLMIAAFRTGGFGASLMSLSVGLLISMLWILGIRPVGLDAQASAGSMLGLPVIALLATVMPPIAVGLGGDARRRAAQALRVSERRFRESLRHSPIGMLIADLEGRWTDANLALQQMLGYTAEELAAMPPGGPSKDEDWTDSASRWHRLLAGEIEFYEVTRCFQHKLGHWVWTHVAVSMLCDEDGAPLHLIAQIESLEARRLAEEKLAGERERLMITLRCINDAVITTDAQRRITYVNAAAESLLGLELSAVEMRRVDDVIHLVDPRTSRAAANLIGQSALHGTVFRREVACLLHRSDGSICYVMDVVSPVMDSSGSLNGLVIVFRDATLDVDRSRELQHRASHDPLTGLSNRSDFDQRLRAAFEKTRLLDYQTAVIAIDLDRFKAVNDAAGHAAGDAVLCKIAEACRATVRSSDTVARLGGDEFAIILDNCAEARARAIGQQLLGVLNSLSIEWAGAEYHVTASVGLAMASAAMPDEKAWFNTADEACYVAKREGRAQLRVA